MVIKQWQITDLEVYFVLGYIVTSVNLRHILLKTKQQLFVEIRSNLRKSSVADINRKNQF